MGRGVIRGATVVAIVLLAATFAAPATRAAATFGQPSATSTYGESIRFTQPVTTTDAPRRVELLVDFPGAAGPESIEVNGAPKGVGSSSLTYRLDPLGVLPNTTLVGRWRLTYRDGSVDVGPSATVRYDDTRFDWKTRVGDIVRVHWYEGSDAFGKRALDIGDKAVRETSQLLGVTETDPVDFFIYAQQEAFYDALGPGTRENVGGQANAEIRTLFALITPGEIDDSWVGIVIPHELTHLVFDTAVKNAYHFPPRWLNEGLAVYLSQGYDASDRASVRDAARDGSLMPLDALGGDFPSTRDRFFLAYAESVSSIDYFIRTYGRDRLIALIRSYARGLSDDEAFRAAITLDVAQFDAAWRKDLAAQEPKIYGPQPPPAGPLPSGWTQADGSVALPLPTARPSAAPGSSGAPASGGNTDTRGGSTVPIIIAALGVLVAVGVIGYALARPRRRPLVSIAPAESPPAESEPLNAATRPPTGPNDDRSHREP
jgi:hypothetical protein